MTGINIKTIATQLLSAVALLTLTFPAFAEPVKAQRIVALAPHIVESLYEIGAGDRIVATVDYADYPAAALEIPRIGGYHGIQMEKVLELQPDLIIVWKNGNRREDIEKLERLGLPVAYSETSNVADIAKELRYFGELTGQTKEAEKAAAEFTQTLTKITQTYQSRAKLSGFYQLWPEPMRTVNKNTWIHELMTRCGLTNVFAEADADYPQIGIENVVVAKPQIMIMPNEKSDRPQPKIDWQQWPVIPAVKNQAYVGVNADVIHRFSKRILVGLTHMCEQVDEYRKHY